MEDNALVLVTGAAGFLGSHVVSQLLDGGYRVRATAREASATRILSAYQNASKKPDVVIVENLLTSELAAAFQGVDAVIHVVAPLVTSADARAIVQASVSSVTRILQYSRDYGVKKIVFASTVIALADPEILRSQQRIGEHSYSSLTVEDAERSGASAFDVYCASKAEADRAIWKYKDENPELDIAVVYAPYIHGPAGPGQTLKTPAAGSNHLTYKLLVGPCDRPIPQPPVNIGFIHVADCAHALVLALRVGVSTTPRRIIVSGGAYSPSRCVLHLQSVRPSIASRLPAMNGIDPAGECSANLDTSSAARILGMVAYKGWQETLEETVDDILEQERLRGLGSL